jgi:hypothetical protein
VAESTILRRILLACGQRGVRLWRNNAGVAHHKDGSRVRYGLCGGSSDLIGFRSVEITPDMVGSRIAQFVALEVKSATGRATREQNIFLAVVRVAGGVAAVVRSEDEARAVLNG